jgi:peroxiredoxin
MRIKRTQKSAMLSFHFSFLTLLIFALSFQIGNAQSSNLKPNIAPDEFTAKGVTVGWKEGNTVPNLTFNDVNNKKAELYKLLEKPTILEFWTLDCDQCAKNKRYLKAFYKQFDINIVGICTDEYINQIRQKAKEQDLHWMNIYDDSKKFVGKTFAQAYNLGDPKFILIAPDKTIYKIFYDESDVKKLGVELQKIFSN